MTMAIARGSIGSASHRLASNIGDRKRFTPAAFIAALWHLTAHAAAFAPLGINGSLLTSSEISVSWRWAV